MKVVTVNGKARETVGTGNANAVRRQGLVPCVIYGDGNVKHFVADPMEFREMIYTPDFKLCNLVLDGAEYNCILKDAQFHPVTDELLHVDLQALIAGNAMKLQVPLRLVGSPIGVKSGGKLSQSVRKIKIKTTPEKLIDELEVNVSMLAMRESVRVSDIVVPEGVEIMNSPSIPVASVDMPRAMRSAATKEAQGALDGEEGEEGEEGEDGEASTEE